jgi:hypothetical protein
MRRPPYLRWTAALAILIGAAALELDDRTTSLHPFTTSDIEAGDVIDDSDLEWRPVPQGLLPAPALEAPVAAHDLRAGEPLTPSAVAADSLIPSGWWSIPLTLPGTARAGAQVRLVILTDNPNTSTEAASAVEGIVVEAGAVDAFSVSEAGLVAVPADAADRVAVAAADERLIVLFRP